ncbi:hypothetical protein KOJCDNHJ_00736 [Xanthomonas citri pv. punicae]|nr:hypothetical protein KOJCDNHJ_00736 [Xanthomonas citri pv. punicae]
MPNTMGRRAEPRTASRTASCVNGAPLAVDTRVPGRSPAANAGPFQATVRTMPSARTVNPIE